MLQALRQNFFVFQTAFWFPPTEVPPCSKWNCSDKRFHWKCNYLLPLRGFLMPQKMFPFAPENVPTNRGFTQLSFFPFPIWFWDAYLWETCEYKRGRSWNGTRAQKYRILSLVIQFLCSIIHFWKPHYVLIWVLSITLTFPLILLYTFAQKYFLYILDHYKWCSHVDITVRVEACTGNFAEPYREKPFGVIWKKVPVLKHCIF